MNINNKVIWQQAAGDTDRNYIETCLKWDVILNGPGNAGVFPDVKVILEENGASSKKITNLSRFAEKMKDGDVVVLRLGTNRIYGVGIIVGEYEWLEDFSDIDGWDLQHVRRVKWLWKEKEKFPIYSLKLGDPTQRLDSELVEK